MTLSEALRITDPEAQRQAMNALPPVILQVADLSFPEYFALLQLRGSMPNPLPAQVAESQQAERGLTRPQQLALIWDGLQLLQEKGAVHLPGTRNADGDPEMFLHPFIQLASEAQVFDPKKALLQN